MADDPGPVPVWFERDIRAVLDKAEADAREALADAMDEVAASIKLRAAMPMSDAAARERDRCTRIARRYWYRGGKFIAAKLWSNEC